MIARSSANVYRVVAIGMATIALLCVAQPARPQVSSEPGREVVLRYEDRDSFSYVRPMEPVRRTRAAATTINVTYNGFSAQAQTAFQFAVDIWEGLVNSSVPIEVDATWTMLPMGVLGSARANHVWSGGALPAGAIFPDALGDSLLGYDICSTAGCSGDPDIIANFASTFDWYYGTDGNVPAGKVDLVSVVLHELGHGLGFSGLMRYDDGVDPPECTGVPGDGCRINANPGIYDVFVDSPTGTPITNYPTPSVALGTALTNNAAVWAGTNGKAPYGGNPVPLYSPATFEPGSSYSHLNESTFSVGNVNSLMTPVLTGTEAIHTPGPITLGMFNDMGWSVNPFDAIFANGFEAGNANAWSSKVP